MNKKRVFALALPAAVIGVIATASVALADPTSSHSGGAKANQIGVVRIDPNNPMAAYVTGTTHARPVRRRTSLSR